MMLFCSWEYQIILVTTEYIILFNRLLKTKSPQCEEMRYPGYFFMLQLSQLHLNKNNLLSHVDLILEKLDE